MQNSIQSRTFGQLADGKIVEAWVLRGSGGLVVEAIAYGATVTRILVPDREGRCVDVALGFSDLESYLQPHPYFGSIVGRVAGRLSGASFELNGHRYKLTSNDSPNHLHGGNTGLHRRLWSARVGEKDANIPCIRFEYQSPNGEEGYPGAVDIAVEYSITPNNALLVEITAESDTVTPFSPTSHIYFNLCGESSGSIEGHELQILADSYVPADPRMTLADRLDATEGTCEDFRQPQILERAIDGLFQRHGSLYLLSKQAENSPLLQTAARLQDHQGGRTMRVLTTESFLQFYSGSQLDGSLVGKSGVAYQKHAGLCLECHGYPNGPNCPGLEDISLRPGQLRRSTTAYVFGNAGTNEEQMS